MIDSDTREVGRLGPDYFPLIVGVNDASEVVIDLPGAQFRLDSEYREQFSQLWVRACHEADGCEMDAHEDAGPRPVITADQTVSNGLVVRWRHSTEDRAILSASRDGVMIHGDVFLNDVLRRWIFDAERASEAIRAGREDDAKAMATHERDRAFCGDLVPVVREAGAS